MKKIGILFGRERSFPMALIERINGRGIENVSAEPVRIDKVVQGEKTRYAVIVDRISQDVPFYRSYLKNAALTGTAVINNPFWWSADEKFFNNCLMTRIGIPVPKSVILPSYELPYETTHDSFSNLTYPLDWHSIFNYVGFPAYLKPVAGGNWQDVHRLKDADDFYSKHTKTGQLVMMLQEAIEYQEYYRCYCIGNKYVHIMPFEPHNKPGEQYSVDYTPSIERTKQIEEIVLQLNTHLGYDFNSVELAVRNGVPYAIDFYNPAANTSYESIGEANFEWVVENLTNYIIERALSHKEGEMNLTWGKFIQESMRSLEMENLVSRT
ncbi:hypothetical protein OCK74_14705 [Chitinophagaceae bacterium LB-8]|uniref:ATP-grasp domain-containing protein n=1 Tax=Paraflavisolibacter caeni TaxID=2982496 RepID=A0A9X2XVX9_9BACT|nr:hypothetical protein [Paraflavisolibacter caeni]MCU7550369.1 hypothetical protein [Paraflavisolibacter caeni]